MARWLVIAAVASLMSFGDAFAADLPANIQTPTTSGWFRVNPATGTLTPLEKIKPVKEIAG
jgi:hypothetical protein